MHVLFAADTTLGGQVPLAEPDDEQAAATESRTTPDAARSLGADVHERTRPPPRTVRLLDLSPERSLSSPPSRG